MRGNGHNLDDDLHSSSAPVQTRDCTASKVSEIARDTAGGDVVEVAEVDLPIKAGAELGMCGDHALMVLSAEPVMIV